MIKIGEDKQMTNSEIQYFLDVLVPRSDKQKRSYSANERLLSEAEKNRLYNIARKLCSDRILKKKEFSEFWTQATENPDCKTVLWDAFEKNLTKDFDHILAQIADILKTIGYNQNLTRTNLKDDKGKKLYTKKTHIPITITSGYTNMPFLIKQVLYLFSVRLLQANYAFEKPCYYQNRIFNELHNVHNIPISHNFFYNMFSDMSCKVTPTKYWEWIKYEQPENPLKYMGQKNKKLGIAIKHLAGQAELTLKYDFFVDVFGGSSSATVAPVYKKNVTYIYNDIAKLLSNYVEVVASDSMSEKLIEEMLHVRDFVAKGEGSENYFDEIQAKMGEYIKNSIKKKETKDRMENIQEVGEEEVEFTDQECIDFLDYFQKCIMPHVTQEDLTNSFADLFGDERDYSIEELRQYKKTYQLVCHYPVIQYLTRKYTYCEERLLSHTEAGEKRNIIDIEKDYRKYRALGVLIENKNIYFNGAFSKGNFNSRQEKIQAVKILLIIHYFRMNLEEGSDSSVVLYNTKNSNEYNVVGRFCEEDFSSLIKRYHSELKRVRLKNIKNMDYANVIKKYTNKNTLFYVDSPYVGTMAYKQNNSPWTTKDMKKLIDELFNSRQRFIFSMRACKDVKSAETEDTEEKIVKINAAILEVFRYFSCREEENKKELYVLAVDFDMDDLEERITTSQRCEIMIVNYQIRNFYNIEDKINANFIKREEYKCLRFADFFKIAEKALLSFDSGSTDL